MGQSEYNAFKARMKQWMSDNADTYDDFEALMNSQSDAGYQKIMAQAMALVPKYEKAVSKKMNSGSVEDTFDIEALFADEKLDAKLLAEFDATKQESVVPAAICWLFFGRSFENMVERGEEIMNNPNVNRFQSFIVTRTTKMLIKKSIDLGLRTREGWDEYNRIRKVIDSGEVMDWALAADEQSGEQPEEKRKPGRPSTAGALADMFSSAVRNKKKLIEKIGEYLTSKHGQSDIARLKIALDELQLLISPVNIKSFRDALAEQYAPGIHIVHERGIQDAYSRLTSFVTIKDIKVMVANREEDRAAIDELKEFLRP
jgi:hypothetical protein